MAAARDETRCPLSAENITPLGDFSAPVIPGKPFANLNKEGLPADVSPGMGSDIEYPGSHILCDAEAGTVSADTVGMVSEEEGGLDVVPLWTVSEDRMTLTMDFYPKDCFGNPITDDNYRDWLPEGCRGVDNDALDAAAAKARKGGVPVLDVVVAQGVPATNGRDGKVKLSFKGGDVGTQQADGSINYRERGNMACVVEGEHVASLLPPTSGTPGFDVLGKEIPAKDGKPKNLKAGSGVTTAGAKGGTEIFTATLAGMVVYRDESLTVSDVLEVDSDVDLSSGNVHVEKGSILIKGTVTTGSEVSAADNIMVEVVVEDAVIKAGNDVSIAGGVLMDEGGLIEAGGTVTAKFFRNATIRAGGDVVAEVDFVNCDIVAGGKIMAESTKGVVNGGKYVCSGGMDVYEVGTDVGSPTVVYVPLPGIEEDDLDEQRNAFQAKINELEKYIGSDDAAATLLMAPKEDRAILAELFKAKALLGSKVRKCDEEKAARLAALGQELAQISVKARKTAHAGVTVRIGERAIKLKQAVQASKLHWDPEQGEIAFSGL